MSLGSKLSFAVAGLAVFGVATFLRDRDFGAATAFAFLAVAFAAHACWYLRKRPYFWPLLAFVTVAHVAVLLRWSFVLPRPTITVAPLVFFDFVAIVALLIAVDRLLNGPAN